MFPEGERNVLENAEIGEQGAELEQHPHAPAGGIQAGLVHHGYVLEAIAFIQPQFALLGTVLPADEAQHSGLAAARRSHQRRHLASLDSHRDSIEHHTFAVAESEVAQFYQWGWRCGGHENKSRSVPGF